MSIQFWIIGISLGLIIWLLQRQNIKQLWKIVSACLMLMTVLLIVIIMNEGRFLAKQAWYDMSPWREINLLVIMLTGMVAHYFTSAIEERREIIKTMIKEGKPVENVKLRFDVWEFSYPLFFSVIAYGSLLSQVKDSGINLVNIVLSFQSGFFWQAMLKKKIDTQ